MTVRFRNVNQNSAKNFNMVSIGKLDLYFSYETVVAFQVDGQRIVVSENLWGQTTGKHLNWTGAPKEFRIKREEFEAQLNKVLKEFGLE